MDDKKADDKKAVPTPTKFLVITQVSDDGLFAKFIFQPVGSDGASISLPKGTPALAFAPSSLALHLEIDKSDVSGLTVIGRPHVPSEAIEGVIVHGQTTIPGVKTMVIEGESDPVNITYGPTGPKGYRMSAPVPEKEKESGKEK